MMNSNTVSLEDIKQASKQILSKAGLDIQWQQLKNQLLKDYSSQDIDLYSNKLHDWLRNFKRSQKMKISNEQLQKNNDSILFELQSDLANQFSQKTSPHIDNSVSLRSSISPMNICQQESMMGNIDTCKRYDSSEKVEIQFEKFENTSKDQTQKEQSSEGIKKRERKGQDKKAQKQINIEKNQELEIDSKQQSSKTSYLNSKFCREKINNNYQKDPNNNKSNNSNDGSLKPVEIDIIPTNKSQDSQHEKTTIESNFLKPDLNLPSCFKLFSYATDVQKIHKPYPYFNMFSSTSVMGRLEKWKQRYDIYEPLKLAKQHNPLTDQVRLCGIDCPQELSKIIDLELQQNFYKQKLIQQMTDEITNDEKSYTEGNTDNPFHLCQGIAYKARNWQSKTIKQCHKLCNLTSESFHRLKTLEAMYNEVSQNIFNLQNQREMLRYFSNSPEQATQFPFEAKHYYSNRNREMIKSHDDHAATNYIPSLKKDLLCTQNQDSQKQTSLTNAKVATMIDSIISILPGFLKRESKKFAKVKQTKQKREARKAYYKLQRLIITQYQDTLADQDSDFMMEEIKDKETYISQEDTNRFYDDIYKYCEMTDKVFKETEISKIFAKQKKEAIEKVALPKEYCREAQYNIRKVILTTRKVYDFLKELYLLEQGNLVIEVHRIFHNLSNEWRNVVKAIRHRTLERLLMDFCLTSGSKKKFQVELFGLFTQEEKRLLTMKDMQFIKENVEVNESTLKKTTAEIVSNFDSMTFGIYVMTKTIRAMFDIFWKVSTKIDPAILECIDWVYSNFVFIWERETRFCKTRTQYCQLKTYFKKDRLLAPQQMFYQDRKDRLAIQQNLINQLYRELEEVHAAKEVKKCKFLELPEKIQAIRGIQKLQLQKRLEEELQKQLEQPNYSQQSGKKNGILQQLQNIDAETDIEKFCKRHNLLSLPKFWGNNGISKYFELRANSFAFWVVNEQNEWMTIEKQGEVEKMLVRCKIVKREIPKCVSATKVSGVKVSEANQSEAKKNEEKKAEVQTKSEIEKTAEDELSKAGDSGLHRTIIPKKRKHGKAMQILFKRVAYLHNEHKRNQETPSMDNPEEAQILNRDINKFLDN